MNNVIDIFTKQPVGDTPVTAPAAMDNDSERIMGLLLAVEQDVVAGNIKDIVVGAILHDGTFGVAWSSDAMGERQRLVSELQTDVTFSIIQANAALQQEGQ